MRILFIISIVFLSSCFKKEKPFELPIGESNITSFYLGENYENQIFFDLGTNTFQTKDLFDWDIRFETGKNQFGIFINNTLNNNINPESGIILDQTTYYYVSSNNTLYNLVTNSIAEDGYYLALSIGVIFQVINGLVQVINDNDLFQLCNITTTTTTTTTTVNPCATATCGVTYEGYGYLYNWWAIFGSGAEINGGREDGGIVNKLQPGGAPNTWVVPSDVDWTTFTTYLGGESVAGGKLKTICTNPFTTNNGLWLSPNILATNEVNWVGVPGGIRFNNGIVNNINFYGFWWSSTEYDATRAWPRFLGYNTSSITRSFFFKKDGISIRLVRLATSAEQLLPDGTTSNDNPLLPHYVGNSRTYITVKIGTQVWTAQNLIDEQYNNGSLIPEITDNTAWSNLTTGARCSYTNGLITPNQGQITLCGTPMTLQNQSLIYKILKLK
jgi:uncharacterized protein (TIGR02145 family)